MFSERDEKTLFESEEITQPNKGLEGGQSSTVCFYEFSTNQPTNQSLDHDISIYTNPIQPNTYSRSSPSTVLR